MLKLKFLVRQKVHTKLSRSKKFRRELSLEILDSITIFQSQIATDGQSVSMSWCRAQIWDFWPDIFFFFEIYSLIFLRGRPLWREVGSVMCQSLSLKFTVVCHFYKIFTFILQFTVLQHIYKIIKYLNIFTKVINIYNIYRPYTFLVSYRVLYSTCKIYFPLIWHGPLENDESKNPTTIACVFVAVAMHLPSCYLATTTVVKIWI
jgi:hypothetical protein